MIKKFLSFSFFHRINNWVLLGPSLYCCTLLIIRAAVHPLLCFIYYKETTGLEIFLIHWTQHGEFKSESAIRYLKYYSISRLNWHSCCHLEEAIATEQFDRLTDRIQWLQSLSKHSPVKLKGFEMTGSKHFINCYI